MIELACRAVVLDIEGTVSPVAFVYEVMFPFARKHSDDFLKANWHQESTRQAVELLAADNGFDSAASWFLGNDATSQRQQLTLVIQSVHEMMDRDAKVTGLKQLQGMIWRSGFESGQLVSELFPDVVPRLEAWKQSGLGLYIYSSGSVAAQKLFFGYSTRGDLLHMFSGFFDTTTGPKKEAASYSAIAKQVGQPPASICFVSDITAELDAARAAGLQTVLRPAAGQAANRHPVISSFQELALRWEGLPGQ